MKPSTQRLIVILGSFALMAASVYAFIYFVYPSYQEVQNLRAQRAEMNKVLTNKKAAEIKIKGLVSKYNDLLGTQAKLSEMLPSGPNANGILNSLQAIASGSGVTMTSVMFEYPAIKQSGNPLVKGVGVARVGLNLLGTYEQFKEFLSRVETNIRIMDATAIKIDGGAIPKKSEMNYNLTVDVYYQES